MRHDFKTSVLIPTLFFISAGVLLLALPFFGAHAGETDAVMPAYDTEGRLLLPADYLQWILVGASLGLSYSEGEATGTEMFHHTLMEPTAYRHFTRTGEFREGTMFALTLHDQDRAVLPQRRGRFATSPRAVEMSVKDSGTFQDGWAYFGFGGGENLRDRARAFQAESCFNCHAEHAAVDNVFLQFYPTLVEAAPEGSPVALKMAAPHAEQLPQREATITPDDETRAPVLALRGLDPVHLSEGRREEGKPEIVMDYKGYRYQFISEPSRVQFEKDPAAYSIQNEYCPVVPGAPADPALFTVYEGRIYIFATQGCVATFEADPTIY